MPKLLLSPKAIDVVRSLPSNDKTLLKNLWDESCEIADDPSACTEVAKFPYSPDRLMSNFKVKDGEDRPFGVTVTLRHDTAMDAVKILTINIGSAIFYPDEPGPRWQ